MTLIMHQVALLMSFIDCGRLRVVRPVLAAKIMIFWYVGAQGVSISTSSLVNLQRDFMIFDQKVENFQILTFSL